MKYNLQQAALFESIRESIEEIDSLFKEHGYDPEDFDEEQLESGEVDTGDDILLAYSYIHRLKNVVD